MQQSPCSADTLKIGKIWRSNEPIESLTESNGHSEQTTRLFGSQQI